MGVTVPLISISYVTVLGGPTLDWLQAYYRPWN